MTRSRRLATCALVIVALLPIFAASETAEQDPPSGRSTDGDAGSASLHGYVRDSHGKPIPVATVYLRSNAGTRTLTVHSDIGGAYRIVGLRADVYTLRVVMAGYNEITLDPCVLGAKETKQVDLTLVPTTQSDSAIVSPAEKPQFFDEPKFTIAGVTEAMNAGGHGSDITLPATDFLAKQTVLLGRNSLNGQDRNSDPSARIMDEESLRKVADREPKNFEANQRLGKLLVEDGKAPEASIYLERASRVNPSDYEAGIELASAYADIGQYERDTADPAAVYNNPALRDLYLKMYGNTCFDSRDRYINFPWSSERK